MSQPNEGQNLNTHTTGVQHEGSQGIRRRQMTETAVINYALVALGAPVVDIEVIREQMQPLLDRTFDEYNKWLPTFKEGILFGVSGNRQRYDLRELNVPFGRGVIDVRILTHRNFFNPVIGPLSLGIPTPITHLSPDQYATAIRYIKEAQKVYSSAPDWIWEEPVLWVYSPSTLAGPFEVAFTYSQDCSTFEEIPQRDHSWIKDYFMNLLKRTLGETRGKFGSLPGPGSLAVRGAEMVAEAAAELQRLEKELTMRSYALTPAYGLNRKS